MKTQSMIKAFVSLGLAILILLSSFFLLISSAPFYRFLMKQNGVYETIGLPAETIDRSAGAIASYMVGRSDHLMVEDQGKSLFRAQEIFHMKEVRDIFSFLLKVVVFLLALILVYSARQKDPSILVGQGKAMIFLFAFFGVCSLFFEQAFLLMHKLLFGNQLWAFTEDHYLIRFLPEGFFLWFLVTTISLALALSLILYLIGRKYAHTASRS